MVRVRVSIRASVWVGVRIGLGEYREHADLDRHAAGSGPKCDARDGHCAEYGVGWA